MDGWFIDSFLVIFSFQVVSLDSDKRQRLSGVGCRVVQCLHTVRVEPDFRFEVRMLSLETNPQGVIVGCRWERAEIVRILHLELCLLLFLAILIFSVGRDFLLNRCVVIALL